MSTKISVSYFESTTLLDQGNGYEAFREDPAPWDYSATQKFGWMRAKVLFRTELCGSTSISFSRAIKLSSEL